MKAHAVDTTVAPGSPGIPARDGFNSLLRALLGDRACLPPSPVKIFFHRLDASVGASGPHDFAVRRNKRSRQQRHPRPSHPNPTFVTIAKRPFVWAGMAGDIDVIWVKSEWEYFCAGDWTTQIRLIPFNKFPCASQVW